MLTQARFSGRLVDADGAAGAPRSVVPARPSGSAPDPHAAESDDAALIPLATLREMAAFPLHSVKRHRRLALRVLLLTAALGAVVVAIAPRHYVVESKLIADRNSVIPLIGNPRRSIPTESETPTRLAAEAILKHENLAEMIRQTKLLALWPHIRPPLGRLKAEALTLMHRAPSDSEQMSDLVDLLQKRILVTTNDGTVSIRVDWPDARTAYALAHLAQRNFVAQRHASEVGMITESISILESHLATAQQDIDESLLALKQARGPGGAPSVQTAARLPRPSVRRPADDEVTSLQANLNAKVQTIAQLQALRAQRMTTLEERLTELRKSLGPANPEVQSLDQDLRTMSSDSPQLVELRSEEAQIRARLRDLGVRNTSTEMDAQTERAATRSLLERLAQARPDSGDDPEVMYAKSRLKIATTEYEGLLDRLEGARIELETARAAFKYRFETVIPPELPRHPMKPKIPMLIAAALFLSLTLSVFSATAADLASGRALEPWQVRRELSLPVVAEVR